MRRSYRQPRKLNIVSFLVLLLIAAAVYGVIQFGPAYYRRWQIQGVLSETASAAYPRRRQIAGTSFHDELIQTTINKLRQAGVADPGLRVFISARREEVRVRADYAEQIVHPLIDRTTLLRFQPEYVITANE